MSVCAFLYGRIYLREYLAARAIRRAYLAQNNLTMTIVKDKDNIPHVSYKGFTSTNETKTLISTTKQLVK